MEQLEFRAQVLYSLGADAEEAEELLAYNENRFIRSADLVPPLVDEPFIHAWQDYRKEAETRGVFPVLQEKLVQLRFPIRAGINEEEGYRAATRRGELPAALSPGLALEHPELLELQLYPTPAGTIPILISRCRDDFEKLVQAFTLRNEPKPVPAAQGACIVGGYNNWDRVKRYRAHWETETGNYADEAAWREEFRNRVIPNTALYRDRFILLNDGPYSAVPAEELGLAENEWRHLSLAIRREHECAHYYTSRLYGSMQNRMLDELLADYAGIKAACGRYRADWFLRFAGLDNSESYRSGSRMENYLGEPPLSDGAFRILQQVVRLSARHLEAFDHTNGERYDLYTVIGAIAELTLEELASEEAAHRLAASAERIVSSRMQGM